MSCHWTTPQGQGFRTNFTGEAGDVETRQRHCIARACNNACGATRWGLAMRRVGRSAVVVALASPTVLVGGGDAIVATAAAGTGTTQAVPSAHGSCKNTSLRPTRANIARVTAATLCLIERERTAYRLGLLRANSSLRRIAAGQAKAMVVGDYFGDNTPSGTTPCQRIAASAYAAGAHSIAVAQNIGWGTSRMATPAGMVSIWMHSPPHRQIVLTSGYRDIGIGVAPAVPTRLTKGAAGATYTVEFAARG